MKSAMIACIGALTCTVAHAQTTTLFQDDFENGLSAWTVFELPCGGVSGCNPEVNWHIVTSSAPCTILESPFPSGNHAVRFGHIVNCTIDGGVGYAPHGALRSAQPLSLPAGSGSIALRFFSRSQAESSLEYDVRRVGLVFPPQTTTAVELSRIGNHPWVEAVYDLTPYAGTTPYLWFEFNTGDDQANDYLGWYIDQLRVEWSPFVGVTYCAGDGTNGIQCPCANFGALHHGCASSTQSNGALLTALGSASLSADTVQLDVTDAHASFMTIVQTQYGGSGLGPSFGDGLLCATFVKRITTRFASGGTLHYPGPGDAALSIAGMVSSSAALQYYQAWYRDAAPFCTAGTFNSSNGTIVTWRP